MCVNIFYVIYITHAHNYFKIVNICEIEGLRIVINRFKFKWHYLRTIIIH